MAPDSHMPPHGALLFPFRTEMLASISLSAVAAPVTKIPDKQFVDAVTCLTRTRVLPPLITMPWPRNRCTIPGPRTSTARWPAIPIPCSPAV